MRSLLIVAAVFLSVACSPKQPATDSKENVPAPKSFTQLSFEAGACYGTCPQFSMSIQANGTASYEAKNYNEKRGKFTAVLKSTQLDSLMLLVQEANVYSLKDTFTVPVTDQATYYLNLQSATGKKTIMDYGARGTEGLKRLYNFIFSLRQSQDWK